MISSLKKNNITLRAFSIENTTLSKPFSDLFENLLALLSSNSSSVENRRMSLRPRNGRAQEDVLSFFNHTRSGYIFCTMLRVDSTGDSPKINRDFFEKNKFALSQLELLSTNGDSLYKSHYHFCLNKTHLTTDLESKISISRLEAYLYWLLGTAYRLDPMLDPDHVQYLRGVEKITVGTPRADSNQSLIDEPPTIYDAIRNLAKKIVKSGLVDATNMNELLLDHIISARLTVELDDPKYAEREDIEKVYSAILKPVSDLDHYSIRTRSGKNLVKGENLLLTRQVEVSTSGETSTEEKALEVAMVNFLTEIQ